MSKPELTGKRDPLPGLIHRTLGDKLYNTDIDQIEFTYENGSEKIVAIIDNKHSSAEKINVGLPAMGAQKKIANSLKVPFFLAITYLEDVYPIKMMYLKPLNFYGCQAMQAFIKLRHGDWFSIYDYAKFLHKLRNEPFLKTDLSTEYAIYKLPLLVDCPNYYVKVKDR